jgi:hypothetical protein
MDSIYYLFDVEMADYSQKKILPLWEGNERSEAFIQLTMVISISCFKAKHFQLMQREDTGVLFVLVDVKMDGRPFCKTPKDWGPDKFGFFETL